MHQLQATAACVMRITRAWRTLLIFPPLNGSIAFNICLYPHQRLVLSAHVALRRIVRSFSKTLFAPILNEFFLVSLLGHLWSLKSVKVACFCIELRPGLRWPNTVLRAVSGNLRDGGCFKLTTPENTITYHNALCLSPQNLHKHCFQFLLGPF